MVSRKTKQKEMKAWSVLNLWKLGKIATCLCHDFPLFRVILFSSPFTLYLLFASSALFSAVTLSLSLHCIWPLLVLRTLNFCTLKRRIIEIWKPISNFLLFSCRHCTNSFVRFLLHFFPSSTFRFVKCFFFFFFFSLFHFSGIRKGKWYQTMLANNFRQLGWVVVDRSMFAQIL